MKKFILLALIILMICMAMVGCTPDEQEAGTTAAQNVPSANTPAPGGSDAQPSGNAPAEVDSTNQPAPVLDTEDPDETIGTYVIDIGEGVGAGVG